MQVNPQSGLFGEADMGARFSECRKYRYQLWRIWEPSLPLAVFVMMNPSTADEITNDPTITRQVRRVTKWKSISGGVLVDGEDISQRLGGVMIVNVFAWRETDSKLLKGLVAKGVDIVGPENDQAILEAVSKAAIVVCGWGIPGGLGDRGNRVLKLIAKAGVRPHALKFNDDGSPGHPLYLGYDVMPVPIVLT
jgi:hypothetical protein